MPQASYLKSITLAEVIVVALIMGALVIPEAQASEQNEGFRNRSPHKTNGNLNKIQSVGEICTTASTKLISDPNNKEALATIKHWLTSPRSGDRLDAAVAVQKAGPRAQQLTANLIRSLQDESASVRAEAAHALGTIGPSAKSALPALRTAATVEHPAEQGSGCCMVRRDNWIHSAAKDAIAKINAAGQ
ncbi:MAG: HEAT repeat domain-containing protein [Candidatus Obscuribacterales bacterium]|nr:HEAT repeat domain-containing protein [Candidatus Obscuribacterales bacterium]